MRSEELEERMGGVTTYVAFAGINLGSTNKIAMPELRTMAERAGLLGCGDCPSTAAT